MEQRKAIDGKASGLMLLTCAIWGLQQAVLKGAAPDVSPVFQIALRSGISAVMVFALIYARGDRICLSDGTWKPGIAAGLLFALEFLLVGAGLRYTTASHMVIFLYTAPVFAALGLLWKLPDERLALTQWLGIGVAFAGIVVTFTGNNGSGAPDGSNPLLGDLLGLGAAIAWGATTVVIRTTRLSNSPSTHTLLYQLIGGFVVLLTAAILMDQTYFHPTPRAFAAMTFQIFVVSFGSLLLWFWLLRQYLASRLGVLSFLTPLFGIAFGVLLLDEPLEPNFVAGSLLVLLGILLVGGYGWIQQIMVRRQNPAPR
ncbi:membrane protein [Advenella kashmirensis W13003]|uniref:Membrane protein n=1 Tax=Advenella kashmirensis W13003 TaxID=1424334 RepID=V8QXF4_9BURK|nr:DMT family transporter [Advenella kashmirensis]ETF03704.1 membrane protein [Advenella kashmirensis W13003]